MKVLLDANLSYRLVKKLSDIFPECLHVSRTGLSIPAADTDIWKWAKQHNYILIVSNDEDFQHLLERLGPPPKVVLLRTGNKTTQEVADLLRYHANELTSLASSQDTDLLEIYF
jgi:predicted nuclease of predicted toxin-antitoxin system